MLDNHNTHNNLYNIYIQDCRKLNVTDQSIFNTLNNLYDKQIKINLIISKEGSQVKSNFFNNETTSRIISIVKTFALRIWQSRGKVVYKIDQTLKIFGDRAFLDNLYKVPCIIMYKISEKFLCRNQVGLKNPLKKVQRLSRDLKSSSFSQQSSTTICFHPSALFSITFI